MSQEALANQRPGVGAIIVTYHTGPALKECLYALRHSPDIMEMIIIDNGNPPDVIDWLKAFAAQFDHIKYIATGTNLGFGAGVNLGVKQSQAPHLLILNPDCVIHPDAVPALQNASTNRASPWMIGGRLIDTKGQTQSGPRRRALTLARAVSTFIGGAGINMAMANNTTLSEPEAVDVCSGAFFLADRAGFDQLNGFDERYFLHVEDIDLCKRALDAGGSVIYQPKAVALHYGSTSKVSALFIERHKAAGFAHYFRTHTKGPLARLGVEIIIPAIYAALMIRALFARRAAPRRQCRLNRPDSGLEGQ